MTTVLDTRSEFAKFSPQWKSPQSELWVSSAAGEYRGMIELVNDRFVATNHHGAPVGEFNSLVQAQRAVDGWSPKMTDGREVIVLKAIAAAALLCSTVAGISLIF